MNFPFFETRIRGNGIAETRVGFGTMDEGLVSHYHTNMNDCWRELVDMIHKDLCDYEDLRYTPEEWDEIQKDWSEYEDDRRRMGISELKRKHCYWAVKERERMKELAQKEAEE